MCKIEDFLQEEEFELELVGGEKGLKRSLETPEIDRPGLSLAGYLKGYASSRILIFGTAEVSYLRDLSASMRRTRLRPILKQKVPAVIVTHGIEPEDELKEICIEQEIPLFSTKLKTMELMNQLSLFLLDVFAPQMSVHGSFMEVGGVGLLIQGVSSIGKSEAALGLIKRGHRLISDDLVKIKRKGKMLVGMGYEVSAHMLEVRGIGIMNMATLYGASAVLEKKSLDIVVKLEVWDDTHFYDRVGIEEKMKQFLGIDVPYYVLPVKPGRDVILLLETLASNHRLKRMGVNSAREFDEKLLRTIERKSEEAAATCH